MGWNKMKIHWTKFRIGLIKNSRTRIELIFGISIVLTELKKNHIKTNSMCIKVNLFAIIIQIIVPSYF